jgi:hypothetical protein
VRVYKSNPLYNEINEHRVYGETLVDYDGFVWERNRDEEGRYYEKVDVAPEWYEIPDEEELIELIDGFEGSMLDEDPWNELSAVLGIPLSLIQEHPIYGSQEEAFVPFVRRRQGDYRSGA